MCGNNLYQLLENLRTESISGREINSLIFYSSKIALIFLKKRFLGFKEKLKNSGIDWHDLAIDSVVDLFTKKTPNDNIALYYILIRWRSPITNNFQSQFFLHKIIWERVEQHLSRVIREIDPIYSKLSAVLNYHIQKNGFSKFHYFGVTYISGRDLDLSRKIISPDEFIQLPDISCSGSKGDILAGILNYLNTQTFFRSAIPFNALIYKMEIQIALDLYSYSPPLQIIQQEELIVKEITEDAFAWTSQKIDNFYTMKGKLSDTESHCYQLILKDVIEDFKEGGISGSLYDYFTKHFPGVDKADYYGYYHHRLDYLIRLMKKRIKTNYHDCSS